MKERILSVGGKEVETANRVDKIRTKGNEEDLDNLLSSMSDDEISEMMLKLSGVDVDQKARFMKAVQIKLVKEGREIVPDFEKYFELFTNVIIKDKADVLKLVENDTYNSSLKEEAVMSEFKKGLTCSRLSVESPRDIGLDKSPVDYEYRMYFVNSQGGVSETVIVPRRIQELMDRIPNNMREDVDVARKEFEAEEDKNRKQYLSGVLERSLEKLSDAIQDVLKSLLSREVEVDKRGSYNKFIFAPDRTGDPASRAGRAIEVLVLLARYESDKQEEKDRVLVDDANFDL